MCRVMIDHSVIRLFTGTHHIRRMVNVLVIIIAIRSVDKETFQKILTAYIRPKLAHTIQIWSPNLRRFIDPLEKVH